MTTRIAFRAAATPQQVVERAAAWVAAGRPAPSSKTDPLAVGKLPLADVDDRPMPRMEER